MSKFYEIVADEKELDKFLNIIPETDDFNQLYWCLFARKKYMPLHPALSYDKVLIKRGTATKERLKSKLKQLECRFGGYVGKDNIPIPQESLALYVSPAPRDMKRATLRCIKSFVDLLENGNSFNPHQEVLNVIQITSGKEKYHIFDIDNKDEDNLKSACSVVDNKCNVVETRGGFHLLISSKDVDSYARSWTKNWYRDLKLMSDVVGDCLTPLPGCWQGGFIPKLKI
jgi:hypothetical protein